MATALFSGNGLCILVGILTCVAHGATRCLPGGLRRAIAVCFDWPIDLRGINVRHSVVDATLHSGSVGGLGTVAASGVAGAASDHEGAGKRQNEGEAAQLSSPELVIGI
jgi:hypothetical protein